MLSRLPAPRPLTRGFSIWTVLKNAVGRDLNHITMPATINEPLSVLQKCAEDLQHRYERIRKSHIFGITLSINIVLQIWHLLFLNGSFIHSFIILCFYRELVEQAVQSCDTLERLLLVSAFACASYYGSIHREAKPFNPILGETYEYKDNNSWFLAEQARICL